MLKENVKITSKIENYTVRELTYAVTVHFFVALASALSSRGIVLGGYLPFGLGFLSGTSTTFVPAAMTGAFISYFIPASGESGFRYIAALFAILSIKLLLGNYKKIIGNPMFCALISFSACTLTGLTQIGDGQVEVIWIIAEGVLCGASGYFVCKTFKAIESGAVGFSTDELASLLLTVSIVIIGLYDFKISGISLGRILSLLLILTASKYGGLVSGCVSGVTVGFAFLLTGSNAELGLTLALSGLMCGIFAGLGKYSQAVALAVLSIIGAVLSGDTLTIGQAFSETAFACIIFFFIPKNLNTVLGRIFSANPKLLTDTGVKKSLTMRLEIASNALRDISDTVEQVSSQLSKINAPDFKWVISSIEAEACSGCKLRIHCWESRHDSTVDAIMEMTKAIKSGETLPENSAPEEFKGRCLKLSKVGNVTFKKYSDYASRISAENRIDEVRSVVSDQFSGISDMLHDLGEDFTNDAYFDGATAEKVSAALKNIDIRTEEAGCRIDKYGRMTLEFKLKNTSDLIINKLEVMRLVSLVCEREFDVPNISQIGGEIYIVLNEKADITVDFGAMQFCANDSKMCGDAYKSFNDGKGHFLMVLSDGMGTGGRAAVDGAMACGLMTRLIKAGFGYDCSLKFLNSSMLFKSTDESLATVDVASIDLFTGQTELYKAGAAPTVIRRSGKTGKAESTSLPAGILREIGFDKASLKCKVGDIVVMMSDGAVSEGTDWIRQEVEAWRDGSAQELAEKICESAKRRRTDTHEDDITVLTAILNKSV